MFPAKETVKIGETKVQLIRILVTFCSTDDNTQHCYFPTLLLPNIVATKDCKITI